MTETNFLLECEAISRATTGHGIITEGFWEGPANKAAQGIVSANDAINRLITLAQRTEPAADFDRLSTDAMRLLAKLARKIDPSVLRRARMFVCWASDNPIKQSLVIGALGLMTSLFAGPAAGTLVNYVLTFMNELIKSGKISTALVATINYIAPIAQSLKAKLKALPSSGLP